MRTLKISTELEFLIWLGRAFHRRGAAEEKVRFP